jgi:hypothetical protein
MSAFRALSVFSLTLLLGCISEPSIFVHRMRLGKAATRVDGDVLKTQRPDDENYNAPQPGYFALKSQEDWGKFWDGTGSNPRPPQIDFGRKMLLVAVTESATAQALRINQVIETGTAMHAYVLETRPGEGCPMRAAGSTKHDFIVVDHSDKPVHFHVEAESSTSCGDAPSATVQCRVEAPPTAAAKEIMVQTGQVVECEAQKQIKGVFAAVNDGWTFSEFPSGSASKFSVDPKGLKVKFTVDTFGKYGVRYDVVDDAGRKGTGVASVISTPAKDGLFLRVAWGGFEPGDDPDTFPRVALELGTGNSFCGSEAATKPSWCDAKRQGHSIQMKLNTNDGVYPVNVRYTDDRYVGGPHACVFAYKNGAETAQFCDKEARRAGDVWKTGILAAKTGMISATAPAATPPTTTSAAPPKPKPPATTSGGGTTVAKPPPPKNTGGGIFNP